MQIQIGAKICPFCRRDPRSQFEIDITNHLVESGSKALATPEGLRLFLSLFLGMWFAFMAWFLTKEDSILYGTIAAVIGFALPYLPIIFKPSEKVSDLNNYEELESLSFTALNTSEKFLSLSTKDQIKFKFKHHPFKFSLSIFLFFGMIYVAFFEFDLASVLKNNFYKLIN